MNINTISYWLEEGFSSIWKNKKTLLVSLGTIIATMVIIAFFFVFSQNANFWMEQAQEELGKIIAYVDKDLNDDEARLIEKALKKIEGVNDVEFTSKEEAFKEAQEMDGVIIEGIEEDFFPAYYTITIGNYERMSIIISEVKNTEGIGRNSNDVRIGENADKIIKVTKTIKAISITILIMLTVTATLIMMNSVKLIMYARRKEISIMKYVGATDAFIRAPFIIEGVIISLIGVFLTVIIIQGLYGGIVGFIQSFNFVNVMLTSEQIMPTLVSILIIIGISIGVVGSSISIKKYLDV